LQGACNGRLGTQARVVERVGGDSRSRQPPAKAEATFTPPCTKSLPFELKRSPVTLASRPIAWNDSMATRTAIANPWARMLPSRSSLKAPAGYRWNDLRSDPKSDSTVRTGKCPNFTNKAPVVIAIRLAGTYLDALLHAIIRTRVTTAKMIACGSICTGDRITVSAARATGSVAICGPRPRRSGLAG